MLLVWPEGHFKAHFSNRWYVPKTQLSSWWNTVLFQMGKAKGKGNDQCFYKGQGKVVGASEYPDQES